MRSRPRFQVASVLGLLFLLPLPLSRSQQANPDLHASRWKAFWVAPAEGPHREFGVFYFRKTFNLDSVPEHFVIHASADNRYELFVNGTRVVAGPARGDLNHWRYETIDIARHLREGKNALAAVVSNFAELAAVAQMTNETGS